MPVAPAGRPARALPNPLPGVGPAVPPPPSSLPGELSRSHVFLVRWPDGSRVPAFSVGNTAPKAWKCVKVAIRFRLLPPLALPSVPAGRVQLMPKRGGGKGKNPKPPRETGNICRTLSKDRLNKSQAGTVRAAGSLGRISSHVCGWRELAWGGLGCTAGAPNAGGEKVA